MEVHKLANGMVITGSGVNLLSAAFQIYARRFGLTDAESLAVWLYDGEDKPLPQGLTKDDALTGLKKLEGKTIPHLTQDKIR
jgi:hypothetical protein